MEMKDIEAGSVLIDNRGAICIVTEICHSRPAYPITFAVKASGSLYRGRPDEFKACVGKVDVDAFKKAMGASTPRSSGDDIFLPEPLKRMNIKIGDKIKVWHGGIETVAVFEGYKYSRPKYPVSYTINGKPWKGAVSEILGKVA
jgi:hypothetical protein